MIPCWAKLSPRGIASRLEKVTRDNGSDFAAGYRGPPEFRDLNDDTMATEIILIVDLIACA